MKTRSYLHERVGTARPIDLDARTHLLESLRARDRCAARWMSGVEGLAALGIPVVLRSFATVVFPVVAHDPHCPDPRIVVQRGRVLVGLGRSGVLPGYEQNHVAGLEHG